MGKWLKLIGIISVLTFNVQAKTLDQEFADPSLKYRPSCFWGWIGGHITKEGIFSDLTAMKDAGMKGGLIFDLGLYIPEGDIEYGSEEWRDLVDYAIKTGADLGLEIGLQNCPGWATSGGPWVDPEHSMKRVVFSETIVDSSFSGSIVLPAPSSRKNFYRDIAVLAIPEPPALPDYNVAVRLADADLPVFRNGLGSQTVSVKSGQSNRFTFTYSAPVELRSLNFTLTGNFTGIIDGNVEVSDDGQSFRKICSLRKPGRYRGRTVFTTSFPPVKSRIFRVNLILPKFRGKPLTAKLGNMEFLQDERIPDYELLTLGSVSVTRQYIPAEKPSSDASGAIRSEEILNLSRHLKPDGRLDWNPAPGRWTILRFGYTSTGVKNHPTRPSGEGLEVDKMDAQAVRAHFKHALGEIFERAGGAVSAVLIDSWEADQQNWTRGFGAEFSKRNGYDLIPFLPVLSGRIVRSSADSYCFLRDFRRTITDLVTENYYRVMREESNKRGARLIAEPYPGWSFDEFKAAAQVDVVAGEFWLGGISMDSIKRVSSMVETIKADKQLAAEAFTARPADAGCRAVPRSLKPVADEAFVQGVNSILLHSFIHQPRDALRPRFTHGRYGTEFGRLNTWWPFVKPFDDYLSRAGVLLRKGNRVADFLFLKNDGPFTDDLFPGVPSGYDFNYIAPFTLLASRLENGAVVPPGGGTHSVVVFPKRWVADLPMLEKLIELKNGGVILLGPAPFMPASQRDLQEIAKWDALYDRLWPSQSAYPTAKKLADAAQKKGLGSDFKVEPASLDLEYVHRSDGDMDIYFVRNTKDQAVDAMVTFRVSGKGLELWNPVDGSIVEAAVADCTEQETTVHMELPAFGSTFAVFCGAVRDDLCASTELAEMHPPIGMLSWQVEFKPAQGDAFTRNFQKLSLWNESNDDDVKYFSGPATYTAEFKLPEDLLKDACSVVLDLGEVYDLAEVSVNGETAGVCWTKPNTVEITGLVRTGLNRVEITVVNRWINRLIGDEFLPAEATYNGIASFSSSTAGVLTQFPEWYTDLSKSALRKRTTFTTWRHYDKDSQLVPSGLAGPVAVKFSMNEPRKTEW